MFPQNFVPVKPFADFKWKWACLQCTEGLNDPVVLLGVLFRMRKLEPLGVKYSSAEFARELVDLSNDVADTVGVDLARRTGERNIIRNSGQYWRAVGLIAPGDHTGKITLTDFGRRVADHDISQAEFAATTIQTFKLPNSHIQPEAERNLWAAHGLEIYPLRLLLQIIVELSQNDGGYITTEELIKIVIPLSGCAADLQDYVNFIQWYRNGEINLDMWPNCCTEANDMRIAREFLLFLSNYGYLEVNHDAPRMSEKYSLNKDIKDEICEIIGVAPGTTTLDSLDKIRSTEVVSEVERKRILASRIARPNQARFRREVLNACHKCVITGVQMPEVLEAAHIRPVQYSGVDTVANGFALRSDIHALFDTGHLRISVSGDIELSTKAQAEYGRVIPSRIVIPAFTNRDFLRWRWENYDGI